MKMFEQIARVRMAQARMAAARQRLGPPAGALLARGRKHPLTTLGLAAGAGFALGGLEVQPLRLPGLAALFHGGIAQVLAHATRVLAELATSGVAGADRGAPETASDDLA